MEKSEASKKAQKQKRELRKIIGSAIDTAIDKQSGEYRWEDLVVAIAEKHDQPAIRNAFWLDTVRALVHDNLRQRSQIPIKAQLSLWSSIDLELGAILLGDGLAVSYANATLLHWQKKVENQTTVIDNTTARRADALEVIEQLKPEMSRQPDLTTGEWMHARGYASPPDDPPKRRPSADEHAPPN